MDGKIIDLYDAYRGGVMTRRVFLGRLGMLTGGAAAAMGLLPLLEHRHAYAGMIPMDDPRLETGYITYPGEKGDIRAGTARLRGRENLPGVIVIHENRGLNAHIEDVARRIALAGYLVIAPDALSPLGGTPGDPDEARSKIRQLDGKTTTNNYVAAVAYLKTHPQSTGKVGCVGFCWGGGVANQMAVHAPDLTAAVPFYGSQPASEDVPRIRASLLLHYAGLDDRINKGIAAYERALKKASIDYRMYMYEGAKHAFFNDTNASRYHREAAQRAWQRTILFLKEKLKT